MYDLSSLDTLNSKEISLTSKEVEGSSLGSSISSSQIVCLVYLSICRVVKAWYNVLNLKQWRRKLRRNFFSSQSSDEKNETTIVEVLAAFHFIAFLSYASSLQFIGKERAFLLYIL